MMPRTDACLNGGHYNPGLAACVCAHGYNGTRCERLALPACRSTASSSVMPCVSRRPLSCECLRQCVAAGAFAAHLHKFCYERNLSDVPEEHENASFFEWSAELQLRLEAPRLELQPVPRERALQDARTRLQHVPLRHCPRRCSERGACVGRSAVSGAGARCVCRVRGARSGRPGTLQQMRAFN